MADVTGTGGHNSDVLEPVMADSESALLFLAFILTDNSPGTMIVNRGALARIPDERNDGKEKIGRTIKKVLRIRLGWNRPAIFFLQPIPISNKTPHQRFD
jgi:hypothetical protein